MNKGNAFLNTLMLIVLVILVTFAFISSVSKTEKGEDTSDIVIPSAFKEYTGPLATTSPNSTSAKKDIPPEVKPPKIDKVSMSGSYYASNPDYRQEYLIITASEYNEKPIDITGWKLRSSLGMEIKIPTAIELFESNSQGYKKNIILKPGDRATIITSYSPIGSSFKLNKCIGYLQETKTFTPAIFNSCPVPKSDISPTGLSDACLNYIDTISPCRAVKNPPVQLGETCNNFMTQVFTYDSCVTRHKKDKDFYGDDWRIYLGINEKLWKTSREKITLTDSGGKIVSTLSY